MKEDLKEGKHLNIDPKDLWELRPEYQVHTLQVFRDHIYQEQRLGKLYNYLEVEAGKKRKVLPEEDKETKRLREAAEKAKGSKLPQTRT